MSVNICCGTVHMCFAICLSWVNSDCVGYTTARIDNTDAYATLHVQTVIHRTRERARLEGMWFLAGNRSHTRPTWPPIHQSGTAIFAQHHRHRHTCGRIQGFQGFFFALARTSSSSQHKTDLHPSPHCPVSISVMRLALQATLPQSL